MCHVYIQSNRTFTKFIYKLIMLHVLKVRAYYISFDRHTGYPKQHECELSPQLQLLNISVNNCKMYKDLNMKNIVKRSAFRMHVEFSTKVK